MKKKTLIIAAMAIPVVCFTGYQLIEVAMTMRTDATINSTLDSMSDEEKKALAASVLERKCGLCHNANATVNPVMNVLSGGLMKQDLLGAQRSYLLQPDGDLRHFSVDMLKLDRAITNRTMPPIQYKIMHWGDYISDADAKLIRSILPEEKLAQIKYSPIKNAAVGMGTHALKIELGHLLYFDKRLSSDNTVSCASCHDLTKGGTDNLEKSEGVFKDGKAQLGGVNAPTVYNAEHHIKQFWDGRAADLKEQAGGPPLNPVEMGYSHPDDWKAIAAKLSKDARLVKLFGEVYGTAGITGDTITDAIAAFEKTLVTPNSAFDRYLKGDQSAMTDQQKNGFELFSEHGCYTCHAGAALGGRSFEYINTFADMRSHMENPADDAARGRMDFTKNEAHEDMFRVPTLRNVALTAPYMHTGKVAKLEDAVRLMFETQADVKPSDEMVNDVTSFLEAQTGEYKGKPLDKLTPEDVAPPTASAPPVPLPVIPGM